MVYHRLELKGKHKLFNGLSGPFNSHLNAFTSGVYKNLYNRILSENISDPIWRELDMDLSEEEHE